jgi:hypothetical protein
MVLQMEDNQQEINKMDLESILGLYGASSKQPTNPDCGKIYLIGIDEENKGDSDDSCSTDC